MKDTYQKVLLPVKHDSSSNLFSYLEIEISPDIAERILHMIKFLQFNPHIDQPQHLSIKTVFISKCSHSMDKYLSAISTNAIPLYSEVAEKGFSIIHNHPGYPDLPWVDFGEGQVCVSQHCSSTSIDSSSCHDSSPPTSESTCCCSCSFKSLPYIFVTFKSFENDIFFKAEIPVKFLEDFSGILLEEIPAQIQNKPKA